MTDKLPDTVFVRFLAEPGVQQALGPHAWDIEARFSRPPQQPGETGRLAPAPGWREYGVLEPDSEGKPSRAMVVQTYRALNRRIRRQRQAIEKLNRAMRDNAEARKKAETLAARRQEEIKLQWQQIQALSRQVTQQQFDGNIGQRIALIGAAITRGEVSHPVYAVYNLQTQEYVTRMGDVWLFSTTERAFDFCAQWPGHEVCVWPGGGTHWNRERPQLRAETPSET
jgi:hypothetical protein